MAENPKEETAPVSVDGSALKTVENPDKPGETKTVKTTKKHRGVRCETCGKFVKSCKTVGDEAYVAHLGHHRKKADVTVEKKEKPAAKLVETPATDKKDEKKGFSLDLIILGIGAIVVIFSLFSVFNLKKQPKKTVVAAAVTAPVKVEAEPPSLSTEKKPQAAVESRRLSQPLTYADALAMMQEQ